MASHLAHDRLCKRAGLAGYADESGWPRIDHDVKKFDRSGLAQRPRRDCVARL